MQNWSFAKTSLRTRYRVQLRIWKWPMVLFAESSITVKLLLRAEVYYGHLLPLL